MFKNFSRTLMRLIQLTFLWVSWQSLFGQVDVHKEPLHQPVLTNQVVRVLDVIALPGDTSLIHQHSNNYCYVTINGGKIWVENKGERGRSLELPTGYVGGYFENPGQPLIHRFANQAAHFIRLIAIENLSLYGNLTDTVYQTLPNEKIILSNSHFIVSKIILLPNERLVWSSSRPAAVINLNPKPLQINSINRSANLDPWSWIDSYHEITIYNTLSRKAEVVLVQLKSQ